MEKLISKKIKIFNIALLSTLFGIYTFAQEKAADLKVDVDINKGNDLGSNWMSNPLVWVIGVLVLILLVVLVTRNGSKSN